jgi:hypothetical protein
MQEGNLHCGDLLGLEFATLTSRKVSGPSSASKAKIAFHIPEKHHLRCIGVDETVDIRAASITAGYKFALRILYLSDDGCGSAAANDDKIHSRSPLIETAEIGVRANLLFSWQRRAPAIEGRCIRRARCKAGRRRDRQ